ncbi:MAG: hypothetical protein HC906_03160, partial [Bacteroidales bacterium]|nr:hypothetical protein [Bacteroidales bacterium]
KVNTATTQIKSYFPHVGNVSGPPSTNVYSIFIDKSKRIWLGTGNGISIMNPETEQFKNYSTKKRLSSQTVLSILVDHNQIAWLSTPNGISKFDESTGVFINYDNNDGILPNAETSFIDENGTIYFGGVNGITIFTPIPYGVTFLNPRWFLRILKFSIRAFYTIKELFRFILTI